MGWSNQRRKRRNQARIQAQFGPLTGDERIITLMTVLPVAHAAACELASAPAGSVSQNHALRQSQDAAARFPQEPITLVLSEFSLIATDIHPLTGAPSKVLARYEVGEIAGLHSPGLGTSALLSFVDGGAVTLRGIAGVATQTKRFYSEVAGYLTR